MKTKDNDQRSHQVTEPVGVHNLTKQTCPETNEEKITEIPAMKHKVLQDHASESSSQKI